ncbi:phage major capsid protein [Saccharopolyspora pogona]|uniref:phage major capsid protein n=1 Tax=Saccharopolyspora pogona TaxID=333966 RepID=UPI001CC24479|nr:phage major capsid protein [Saccharopolyspora pogona]
MINEVSPSVTTDHQGRLAYLPDDLLPKELVGPIFEKAQESSLVLRMAQQIPVGYGETVIPVNTKRPEVGQVGTGTSNAEREGAKKPTSGVAWGSRSFSPIKLATIVTVSEEFARSNVNGLYTQIQSDLAYAIGRGIDLAVFHGKQPLTGTALSGIDTANVLANSTNSVTFGTDIVEDLLAGYDLVADTHEFDGWAADTRFRGKLARAMVQRDVNGNVADPASLNLASQNGSLLGFPVQFGRAVGGDLGLATDSNIRLIGGDFSQLRYGYADQVRVKVSDTATLLDGTTPVSMWQTNQIAILIEVTFGWVVGNLGAFTKFSEPVTP